MDEYDITKIFREMETDLINSMHRTMKKHMKNEDIEGINWTQFQSEQLKALQEYRKRNKDIIEAFDERTISNLETLLKTSYKDGALSQERQILQGIVDGARANPNKDIKDKLKNIKGKTTKDKVNNVLESNGTFFKTNDKKLNALINASKQEVKDSYKNILRYSDDIYRQVIFKAELYANTGVKTIYQAVDMATKDFLSRGITNITYKNGAKVNIESYAEMCIRTANKKAKLEGEGQVRDEWGEHLVLCSQYGACSPLCLPWQGKVYIDNVYSNGKADGKYPLLSDAMEGGLFHPNCRHTISNFFEGISSMPNKLNEEQVTEHNKLEQQQRYLERQVRKYERLKNGSLDPNNRRAYEMKQVEWSNKLNALIKDNKKVLRRDPWRETTLLKDNYIPVEDIPELFSNEPESIGDILEKIETPKKPILERLKDKNVELEGRFSFDDEEIQEHLINQMDDLTNRYNVGEKKITIKSKKENNNFMAYFTHNKDLSTNSITFNKNYYDTLQNVRFTEINSMDSSWSVKAYPEKVLDTTLAHEFGHLLERNLVDKHFKIPVDDKDFFNTYNKVCINLQKEILDMYKTKYGRALDIPNELSRYALTNSKEFFAEAFAKLEVMNDSEVAEVMREFLKKYNMIKE